MIIYLDQNKFIEIGRALKHPDDNAPTVALAKRLQQGVDAGDIIIPISHTHIYETHKTNDFDRRYRQAFLLAALSKGKTFRSRSRRLEHEVAQVLCNLANVPATNELPDWFLSDYFFESAAEMSDRNFKVDMGDRVLDCIRQSPPHFLLDFLVYSDEAVRKGAVANYTSGIENIRQAFERRRQRLTSEPTSMHRKILRAETMIAEMDRILSISRELKLPFASTSELGAVGVRRLSRDVPIYNIEVELSLKLEQQDRTYHENDFRDMDAFCAALPYSDIIVAEKPFVNMSKQAALDRKYKTQLITELDELNRLLS